jgi:hypothetical protein
MKTNRHLCSRSLAVACLAVLFQGMALRASAGPPEANMVVETAAPGLARLEVLLTSKEWKEPRRFVFEGKDSIVGGIALPKEYPAEYSMTAFDAEGKEAYSGKGPIPPVAVLDKPLDIALHGEKGDGLVISLNRERIALEVRRSPESENEMVVHADVFDAQGNLAKIDPEELTWQLSDGRYINLHRKFEPFDINLVPDKGIQFAELCSLTPVVTACRLNTQCKPIKVCSDPFVKVSAGSNHTCALTQSGAAFCWGLNMDGQLGAPTTTSCISNSATGPKCSSRPVPVVCPAGAPCRFTQISSGQTLTAAVDVNGDVWWWGRGLPDHHKVSAVLAGSPVKFSSVAAGFGHGCAISQSRSEIWCWGANGYGEAGVANGAQGGTWDVPDWAPVRVLAPFKFRKVVAGGEHSCAIGSGGTDVVCWGRDDQNQTSGPNSTLFSATGTAKFFFQQFGGLVSIQDVGAQAANTCVTLAGSNGVRCWGESGWLNVSTLGAPDKITPGFTHVCGLSGQQAQCMGTNNWGELGINSMAFQSAAVNVNAPPAQLTDLSAGYSHTCGITPDGNAFCWGRNLEGQVGNGSTAYSVKAPVQVVTP